ncbi:MAG: helix-turn-helix transcriptional regulator [Clostridia bacterium]|nr:helix-turn-helix transcriptional regulator [Clostridia bacterium]
MFFQPIVLDKSGFQVKTLRDAKFPMHWHSDIEILYCREGVFYVENEENKYKIEGGDIMLISSCEPHCLSSSAPVNGNIISLGFLFFGDEFNEIRNMHFDDPVLKNNKDVIREMSKINTLAAKKKTLASHMELRGRIYHLVSILLESLSATENVTKRQQERLFAVSKIQKALDFVAMHYSENITVEQAAAISGYEKSSFCRSFKNATNATFHNYLNAYRVKKARILLTESDDSISVISYRVGFTQHKNFCRLFKEINGISPSDYRKKYR